MEHLQDFHRPSVENVNECIQESTSPPINKKTKQQNSAGTPKINCGIIVQNNHTKIVHRELTALQLLIRRHSHTCVATDHCRH